MTDMTWRERLEWLAEKHITREYRTTTFGEHDARQILALLASPQGAEPAATQGDAVAIRLANLLEEADGSQRFKDCAAAFLGGHGTELLAALSSPPGVQAAQVSGIAKAAAYVQKKADDYAMEHCGSEPDTGAATYHYGRAGEEYHHTLLELAEEVAALAQPGSAAHGGEVSGG